MRRSAFASCAAAALCALALPAYAPAASYPDGDGHAIEIVAAAPTDASRDELFAGFLGSLLHADEMDALTVQLAGTETEHAQSCGGEACYVPDTRTIHTRGFEPAEGDEDGKPLNSVNQLPQTALARAYGRHIAASRVNPPFAGGAFANGTKRWATDARVCSELRSGRYDAGEPGLAFALAYASLATPVGFEDWPYDPLLFPDDNALELITQDVVDPWTGPATVRVSGRFSRGDLSRQGRQITLPLDGVLRTRTETTGSLDAKVIMLDGEGGKVKGRGPRQRLSYEICGTRSSTFLISRLSGTGRYTLVVRRP